MNQLQLLLKAHSKFPERIDKCFSTSQLSEGRNNSQIPSHQNPPETDFSIDDKLCNQQFNIPQVYAYATYQDNI
jgi:hypothetical protein